MLRTSWPALLFLLALAGCARPSAIFSDQNARAHVEMLAGTIGSRPPGTDAHRRAREYIVDQLRIFGYQVRVQETDARRPELGRTGRVANIIAVLPGTRREAIALLSHYDSRADTPGAGDDAFGVAVSLEAARVIAARTDRQWTTFVLVTDVEEDGLMGAAALMNDPEVGQNLACYINLEATGSAGPVMLFETGPGNRWLVSAWARFAPRPRGGSFAVEIYKRLPNDTDFSILKRHEVPGLNLALVGDSYAYHTVRDTPDRLRSAALRDAGENVVAIVAALQHADITARTAGDTTYFDIAGTRAVSYGTVTSWVIATLAVTFGFLAWLRVTRYLIREEGVGRWVLDVSWAGLGLVITVAAMIGATAALRSAREAYHPWYAHPDRFFLMVISVGATTAWATARIGRWIPARAKGLRHPAVVWTAALPLWLLLALAVMWFAPAAGYLWVLPLLSAGVALLMAPPRIAGATRVASIVVLAVAATLWLRDLAALLRFMVAVFGRLPFVTPVYVYPAIIAIAGLMVVPPLVAVVASERRLLRPALTTAILLGVVTATSIGTWLAPAYSHERPLRAVVRAVQEPGAATSMWQMGALEPGVELGQGGPSLWTPGDVQPRSLPWGRLGEPFVFSATGPPLGAPPASVGAFTITPVGDGGSAVSLTVIPKQPAVRVSFVLPAALTPARTNLPGIPRAGRWTATYIGIPAEGIAWQAVFGKTPETQLRELRVVVTSDGLPGGPGMQHLPAWIPQDRTVWTAWSTWILDPSAPAALAPVPPLR